MSLHQSLGISAIAMLWLLPAHAELGSVTVATVETGNQQKIELVATKLAISPQVKGKDAVKYAALYLTDSKTAQRTLLYQEPSWPEMAETSIRRQASIGTLSGALVSESAIEILIPGIFDSYALLRFTKRDGRWDFVGKASIHDTRKWGEESELVDWGKIRIKQTTIGNELVFTVDPEGVVRVDGKPYIPKTTLLGGTDGPEIAYQRNYKSYVEEYNLPRDANGMTIWEDPSVPRTPTKVDSSTNKAQKQTPTSEDNPTSASAPPAQPTTKPESSSFMLWIISGIIVLGLAGLVYRLKRGRR